MFFVCCICGSWVFDGDPQSHICLSCIDDLIEWGDLYD